MTYEKPFTQGAFQHVIEGVLERLAGVKVGPLLDIFRPLRYTAVGIVLGIIDEAFHCLLTGLIEAVD
jgi:hypothetical protein